MDVFYFDEIADATGLLFDHARQDTQWGENNDEVRRLPRSKSRLKKRVETRMARMREAEGTIMRALSES